MKTFEIDFGGNVLAKIVVEDNELKVVACINGWGDSIDIVNVAVKEIDND